MTMDSRLGQVLWMLDYRNHDVAVMFLSGGIDSAVLLDHVLTGLEQTGEDKLLVAVHIKDNDEVDKLARVVFDKRAVPL